MTEGKTHTTRLGREIAKAEHAVQYAERSLDWTGRGGDGKDMETEAKSGIRQEKFLLN